MTKGARVAALLLVLLVGCSPAPPVEHTHQGPQDADDTLEVGTLAEDSVDVALLGRAVDAIRSGQYGEVHSLLFYKDGELVLEEYFPGHDYAWDGPGFHGALVNWHRDKRHNIHSVGKTVTSACVGIAVDRGFIRSVDQSIFDYLPEHQHLNAGGKDRITIEHLLTMTAGLAWDEWGASYGDEGNDVIALWFDCDDPVTCILGKPLVNEPGTVFTYSGGDSILLGEIVRNATGMDIEAFSWEYLFGPLGIEAPAWTWIEDTGVVYAGGDQRLAPREMLRFGVTYLNDGVWNGEQVIPQAWVEKSAEPYSGPGSTWLNHPLRPIPPGDGAWGPRGYSYTWWTHRFPRSGGEIRAYWALGWGGQKIVVFPEHDAVVVMTGANYASGDASTALLATFVVPALR